MSSTPRTIPQVHHQPHCHLALLHGLTWLLALLLPMLAETAWGQTPVSIPDPNLEAAVRAALENPPAELTTDLMGQLTVLAAPNRGITSLAGLETATNLQYMNLEGNAIADASPLAGLTLLQHVVLTANRLTTGAPFAGLTNLRVLELNNNDIQDINWVAGLTQLTSLSLMFNSRLGNCAPVGGLRNLTELYLNGIGLSDVSFLRGLNQLTLLGLGDNLIRDGTPIGSLPQLTFLGLGNNQIANWTFMRNLTNLRTLYLFQDSLSDVSFLSGMRNLTWLRLDENQIQDASPLAQLTQLQYVNLRWNQLSSCSALAALTALTNLDLSINALTEVSGLSGLRSLSSLTFANNQVQDGSPLANLTALRSLDVSQNRLANLNFAQGLAPLTDLNASYNRLTDIQGLLGAVGLSTVALNDNLLLLATGSPSSTVIETLESRGARVDASNQSLPYVATSGTYSGLFYVAGASTPTNSGSLTLTATVQRKYSAKLRLGAVTYSFSGLFTSDGTDTKTLQKGKLPPVSVDLVMRGADYLTGTVTPRGQITASELLGYRAVFDGKSTRSPHAGRYTLTLAGSNSAALPAGTGYGTLTVNPAGRLTCAGSLADGTKFSHSAAVSAGAQWPLFVPLYASKGAVVGWIPLTNSTALSSEVAWSKPNGKTGRYSGGFSWFPQVTVAAYAPPAKGSNAFGLSTCDMTLTLSGGDLTQVLTNRFTVNAKNQVKAPPTSAKLSLSFTASTGLFTGRAVDPDTRKGFSFSGVILQNQTNGCGFLLGRTASGQVLLCP